MIRLYDDMFSHAPPYFQAWFALSAMPDSSEKGQMSRMLSLHRTDEAGRNVLREVDASPLSIKQFINAALIKFEQDPLPESDFLEVPNDPLIPLLFDEFQFGLLSLCIKLVERKVKILTRNSDCKFPVLQEFLRDSSYPVTYEEYTIALYLIPKLADLGNTGSIYRLGLLHLSGIGATHCKERAFLLFSAAAKKKHLGARHALYHLGKEFENEKDFEKAKECYRELPDYLPATKRLALLASNPEEAFTFHLKAAEGGSSNSMLQVGLMYKSGEGTQKSPVLARKWLERAAEAGKRRAKLALRNLSEGHC